MKALLDTNFLIACVKRKIQIFEYLEEHFSEVLLPRGVIDELVRVAQHGAPRDRAAAEIALKLISLSPVHVLPFTGYVDQQIVGYLREHEGIVVATLDKKLQRILQARAKLLVIRGSKKLGIV